MTKITINSTLFDYAKRQYIKKHNFIFGDNMTCEDIASIIDYDEAKIVADIINNFFKEDRYCNYPDAQKAVENYFKLLYEKAFN